VNSHFRSMALDVPLLWSTIDDKLPLPITKLYLERSIDAPLDIRIGSNGPPAVENGKMAQLFQYLEPHAHRVKALKIVAGDWEPVIRFEKLMDSGISFVGLEKFEFGRCQGCYAEDRGLPFKLAEPNSLRELHLWGYELDQWIDTFPAALRRLHLSRVSVRMDPLMDVLVESPGLGVLVFEECKLSEDEETMIVAESLAELQFIMMDPEHMDRFASHIETPALTSLSVAASFGTCPGDNEFLVNLVESSEKILSVEICDYDLTANDWSAVFSYLPNLTHLRVRASYASDEDLQALTIAQTLPNLTSITLDNELRLTTRFVEQVAQVHPKLNSIVLRGWDPSNVSEESLVVISKLCRNILVETFKRSSEDECDEEAESDTSDDLSTEGSWLSGDDHVIGRERHP
ncbi:hypothetical protein FRC01_012323, partial [Tulasnella sp. 417]